jgi:hypothetical protein
MSKWTDDEKNFILKEYKSGKSIEKIFEMNKIKRSRYAIECKLYGHIYDLLQNGKSHSSVAKEFNKTSDEIKEIEKKAFEMKNQSDVKTIYTGDGGYKYGENKKENHKIDLGEFHHINRTMNSVLSFYENIQRLNKLKKSEAIDEKFYNKLMDKLNAFSFDKEKIIESLDVSNLSNQNLSNQNLSNQNLSNQDTEITDDKPMKKEKKYKEMKDDDSNDNFETKKIKKRLI